MPSQGFMGRKLQKHPGGIHHWGLPDRGDRFPPFSLESFPQNESFMGAQFFTLTDSPLPLFIAFAKVYQPEKSAVPAKFQIEMSSCNEN
ncbi:hypothetical protein [Phormidium sp. CCY1219]|uniref:hypothetical protein n=1 Tax=Phormidium sp. CCY1219 TaxID=2886104 RepID=UPI002D1EADDA|nr:hypothetical protein [Phormidium sp. CCY1219]MEB3827537.1 hypothetical protein [Phormidium sp. CCY1219]